MVQSSQGGQVSNKLADTKPYFNYNGLATKELRALARDRAAKIKAADSCAAKSILSIGGWLTEVKAALAHGEFGDWIEAEFGYSRTTAWQLMNADKVLSNVSNCKHLNLSMSAIFALTSGTMDEETRGEL